VEPQKIKSSKKILVVDDDPGLVVILSEGLTSSGYEVCTAQDGAEALAMAKSEKPDLIVMDVMMPRMTGYEAFEKVRGIDELRKIPAIIVSGKESMRNFFKDLNGVEFMSKPYEVKTVLAKVERLLWESEKQDSDGSKRVVLLGVQEALTNRIRLSIYSLGFQAFIALNEDDAFHLTKQLNAGNVLCQFWEDESIVNAPKLKEKLAGSPLLRGVPVYVYCEERLTVEALKTFSEGRVIVHRSEKDLLGKISELFKG
jgi:two-component system, OmpR family, alkaline phosphatase synthesis response regulator PhoP